MKYDLILVKYGELALKGANRSVFEKRLVMQVKRANADLPEVRIQKEHGRMYIHLNGVSHDLVTKNSVIGHDTNITKYKVSERLWHT